MTDKELLELAAKAAGIDIYFIVGLSGTLYSFLHNDSPWSPLTDDGDALRLAVKLELRVSTHCNQQAAYASDIYGRSDVSLDPVPWDNDPYAATRRAIVRAAAEIGQHMKGV